MRIAALLALLLLLAGPAAAQRMCDQTRAAVTSVPVPNPTERVPGLPGKRVYLCGYMLLPSTSPPTQIEFEVTAGQGSDCGPVGARTVLIPRIALPSTGIVNRVAYTAGEMTKPGQSVCLQTWGTGGSISSIFYWTQF